MSTCSTNYDLDCQYSWCVCDTVCSCNCNCLSDKHDENQNVWVGARSTSVSTSSRGAKLDAAVFRQMKAELDNELSLRSTSSSIDNVYAGNKIYYTTAQQIRNAIVNAGGSDAGIPSQYSSSSIGWFNNAVNYMHNVENTSVCTCHCNSYCWVCSQCDYWYCNCQGQYHCSCYAVCTCYYDTVCSSNCNCVSDSWSG